MCPRSTRIKVLRGWEKSKSNNTESSAKVKTDDYSRTQINKKQSVTLVRAVSGQEWIFWKWKVYKVEMAQQGRVDHEYRLLFSRLYVRKASWKRLPWSYHKGKFLCGWSLTYKILVAECKKKFNGWNVNKNASLLLETAGRKSNWNTQLC